MQGKGLPGRARFTPPRTPIQARAGGLAMADDTTSRRVREIVADEAARAYGYVPPELRDRECGCGHLRSDHLESEGRCSSCGCLSWWDAEAGCPECGDEWYETSKPCPGCGLTIEAIADRIAAARGDDESAGTPNHNRRV